VFCSRHPLWEKCLLFFLVGGISGISGDGKPPETSFMSKKLRQLLCLFENNRLPSFQFAGRPLHASFLDGGGEDE
jgi:hypothetical protein